MKMRVLEKRSMFDIVMDLNQDFVKVDYCSDDINVFTPLPAAGLRSNTNIHPEMVILEKSLGEIDVELFIEKVDKNLCNIRVGVDNLKTTVLMNTLRIELISEGKELISNLFEDGETILEDISTGKFTIKIQKKGKVLGEVTLKVQ